MASNLFIAFSADGDQVSGFDHIYLHNKWNDGPPQDKIFGKQVAQSRKIPKEKIKADFHQIKNIN